MADLAFTVRPGRPSDHALILESWKATHRNSVIGREHGPQYLQEMKSLIRSILARPDTEVRVAVLPDDDDAIVGYAVVGRVKTLLPTVYFCYTKLDPPVRRMGIAKTLLADLKDRQVVYTHKPPRHLEIPIPKLWEFSYFSNWSLT